MLSEVSQTQTNPAWCDLCVESKTKVRLAARGESGQRVQTSGCETNKVWGLMNMEVPTSNTIVLLKFAKRVGFTRSHQINESIDDGCVH